MCLVLLPAFVVTLLMVGYHLFALEKAAANRAVLATQASI